MNINLHIEAANPEELWATLAKLLDAARSNAGSADTGKAQPGDAPAVAPTATAAPAADGPKYDIATLANASRSLVTTGRQAELTALLREFGVARLADVPPQRFGDYALGLRALGIEI